MIIPIIPAVVEAGASGAPSGTTLNPYQYNMHDMIQFGARTVPYTPPPSDAAHSRE